MRLRSKLTIILVLIKLCLIQHSYAQSIERIDSKVDSVFTLYFDFLKAVDSSAIDSSYLDLVAKNIEKQRVIFDFLENVSGLYLKREYRKEHEYVREGIWSYCYSTNNGFTKICVIYTVSDFEKWRQWYNVNKGKLCWFVDNRTISMDRPMNFSFVDYKSFYPNFIRFKDRLDWIPISKKPEYVIGLEREMEREGMIEPSKPKVKMDKK